MAARLALVFMFAVLGSGRAQADTGLYARAGVLHLAPIVDSDEVVLENTSDFADIAIDEGPIAGSGAGVASSTMPAALIGYALPVWDRRLALQTIVGPPITFELEARGTIANESLAPTVLGDVPTGVPPLGRKLGTVRALPPVLTLSYRFLRRGPVRPYAGAGMAYLHLYDPKVDNPVLTEVSMPVLEVQDTLGFVAHGGVEARFYRRYYATLDVKWMTASMEAKLRDVEVATPRLPIFESAHVGDASVKVRLYPLIFFVGAGADF